MGRKCCIKNCKTGYVSYRNKNGVKFPLYRFPGDEHQRRLWIEAIPHDLGMIKPGHRVCARHFVNVKMSKCQNGHLIPAEPPNYFGEYIPASTKSYVLPGCNLKIVQATYNQVLTFVFYNIYLILGKNRHAAMKFQCYG